MKEICENCNKRGKRYRPAFGSYICDKCKIETFVEVPSYVIPNWWFGLSKEKKEEIYNRYK